MLKIKRVDISDYKYIDNEIRITFEGDLVDSNKFIQELLELAKKTPCNHKNEPTQCEKVEDTNYGK